MLFRSKNFFSFFFSIESYNKICKLIENERPDIAHIHLYRGILTPSILYPLKKNKIPIVITLHDYNMLCPHYCFLNGKNEICELCINGAYFNCVTNKCNRNNLLFSSITYLEYIYHKKIFPFSSYFDRMICVSKFSFEKHINTYLPHEKLSHLYNFIPNLDKLQFNDKKGDYILYFGRLSFEKGIITLLNSWLQKKRKTKLYVVGTGSEKNKIEEKINGCSSVNLLGFKEGEELENLIKNCSFVIVPSEWYENNPLTVLEAYAYGKPVAGSKVGGIPEIVDDNSTGFLFEMKNENQLSALIDKIELMSDTEYQTFSNNARKFAEKYFDEESHYIKLIYLYNNSIDNYKNN